MIESEVKDFLDKNKEAFKVLHEKIKSLDTVMGVITVKDFQARQGAIRIINEWLSDLWGIAYPELPSNDEEDYEIFRTINNS